MTDDELDLLASAYVDGEATPDEVAMVERDPELQARVEIFRSVQVDEEAAAVTTPAGLVDRHLAAALAEFEATTGADDGAEDGVESPEEAGRTAPVVDLRDASSRRADRTASSRVGSEAASTGRATSRPARTMPSWLPAAAGFVIVGGGFLWAVGQTGGDDDSADTEAASLATDDGAEEIEADFDAAEESGEDGDAAAMSAMSDEAMEESDEGDDAMAEDEAERAEGAADSEAAAPADDDGDDESAEDDAEAELVEPEPALFFDEIPDVDAIVDLPEPETDIERSLCGPEIITTTLGDFVGFIPVAVMDQPAEIYLFLDGDGAEIRLLIDERCQPIEP